jgi:hypothetical protein
VVGRKQRSQSSRSNIDGCSESVPDTRRTRCDKVQRVRYDATSSMETAQTYPVRNKLPILAPEKSKVLVGLNRFTISKLI